MKKAKHQERTGIIEALLRDLLITSLSSAGVKGKQIRGIVGCDMNKVSRIAKHIGKGN